MPGKGWAFSKGQTKPFQRFAHWKSDIATKRPFLKTSVKSRLIAQKKT